MVQFCNLEVIPWKVKKVTSEGSENQMVHLALESKYANKFKVSKIKCPPSTLLALRAEYPTAVAKEIQRRRRYCVKESSSKYIVHQVYRPEALHLKSHTKIAHVVTNA